MARQSLHHEESRVSMMDNPDVFDDDFAVDDFMVADGFGPARMNSTSTRRSEYEEPPSRNLSVHYHDGPATPTFPPRPNRNSTRKSQGNTENPFMSAEDNEEDEDNSRPLLNRPVSQHSQSTISYTPGISNRSTSSASSRIYAQTNSPLLAPAGPSHPYTMYPQHTSSVARSMSTSTTAIVRPPSLRPSTSTSQHGPTHPYNMYPQNVDDDMEDDEELVPPQSRIPVGFPGMQQPSFHRRLEDDGISIAQSEQLPPYSEYPEDGAPPNIVLPNVQNSTPQAPPPAHTPFASRIPQSMSDVRDRRPESVPFSPDTAIMIEEQSAKPKTWKDKSWKEKRKTKFFGVLFEWWLFVAAAVLIVIVVIAASIPQTVNSPNSPPAGANNSSLTASAQAEQAGTTPTNSLYDASPIASSTAAAIPTGTFTLNIGNAQEVQAECLTNASQSAAWSCEPAREAKMLIFIGPQPGSASSRVGAYIYSADRDDDDYAYGTQVPVTAWQPLQLVTDLNNPAAGPAYQFQAFYSKLVVADPSAFQPSQVGGNSKREAEINPYWFTRHESDTIAAGTQPWFCYWNQTLLEGFIYINQNSSSANASMSMSSSAHHGTSYTGVLTTSSSSSASAPTQWPNNNAWSDSTLEGFGGPDEDDADPYPPYQYVVHIEERRIPGSTPPYCQKMQILDDGQAGLLPPSFTIGEDDPGYLSYVNSGLRRRKRTEVAGSCHCQWSTT
ncbi:hypothetical protein MBLNU457_5817t3 [Dothideomycetes sp. NU457]